MISVKSAIALSKSPFVTVGIGATAIVVLHVGRSQLDDRRKVGNLGFGSIGRAVHLGALPIRGDQLRVELDRFRKIGNRLVPLNLAAVGDAAATIAFGQLRRQANDFRKRGNRGVKLSLGKLLKTRLECLLRRTGELSRNGGRLDIRVRLVKRCIVQFDGLFGRQRHYVHAASFSGGGVISSSPSRVSVLGSAPPSAGDWSYQHAVSCSALDVDGRVWLDR